MFISDSRENGHGYPGLFDESHEDVFYPTQGLTFFAFHMLPASLGYLLCWLVEGQYAADNMLFWSSPSGFIGHSVVSHIAWFLFGLVMYRGDEYNGMRHYI